MKTTPIKAAPPTVIQPRVESFEPISRKLKFIYRAGPRF
jgi:hypothetical protein